MSSSYTHVHYSRRCDTALIPITAGAGVPRDYDAPLYNAQPRHVGDPVKSSYYYRSRAPQKQSKQDIPPNEVFDALEYEEGVVRKQTNDAVEPTDDRSWAGQCEMHRRSYDWYHSPDRWEGGHDFDKGKIMPNPSTYIEDPYYSGGSYEAQHGLRDDLDRDEARESDDENDSARYSDSCREESDSSEEEEWEDDEVPWSGSERDEDESETDDQVAPGIASYSEDIEPIYMPRLLHYTQLPNSLCELIGSYMDPDADLGLLLDDVCTMALRCIDQIGQYRTEAKKLNEYLPEPKDKVLAEELPSGAAQVRHQILEKKNAEASITSSSSPPVKTKHNMQSDEFDGSSDDDDWENRDVVRKGTLLEYPLRLYLCTRSRRALRELEKIIECELDGSVHRTLTQMIMKRIQNCSLPPISRLRLDMMMRLFTREFDAWDRLVNEVESRLDTADEEWRFASNLLMVSDYILTSRSASSRIRPKQPFRVELSGKGKNKKYELKPATKKDDEKLFELLSFPSAAHIIAAVAEEEKKQSDTVPTSDVDIEMKVDDGGADVDDESDVDEQTIRFPAYTISPVNGAEQESSKLLRSTVTEAIHQLEAELSLVDVDPPLSAASSPAAAASSSSDPLASLAVAANVEATDPSAPALKELNLVYPRTATQQLNSFIQDLMKESITSQSYQKIIKKNGGVLDPQKHVQFVLPPSDNKQVDINSIDRNQLALSILNRRQLIDFGEHIRLDAPLNHVDMIEMNRAEAILERAWKFIHRCFQAATRDEVTGEIDMGDESDDDDEVEKPLPTIVTLMHELITVMREPTYAYHAKPQQQVAVSAHLMSDVDLAANSATSVDDHASLQPKKKQKAIDGSARDASPPGVTNAAALTTAYNTSCLNTGEFTILRRVMTPQKHAAAVILTSQLDHLRLFMALRSEDYFQDHHLAQLRRLIESTRIAMSHYYLLHMTRSESLDTEIAALNAHFSVREESYHVDHVIPRHAFFNYVHEVGQDFKNDLLFTNAAVQIIQEACEQEIVRHFALTAPILNQPPPSEATPITTSAFWGRPKSSTDAPDISLLAERDLTVSDLQRSARLLPLKRLNNF